jgi:small subunit ribosomal protein S13
MVSGTTKSKKHADGEGAGQAQAGQAPGAEEKKKPHPKSREKEAQKKEASEVQKPVVIKPGEENLKYIVRIAGTDLMGTKSIRASLNKIRGVSFNFGTICMNLLSLDPNRKVGSLEEDEVSKIEDLIKNPAKFKIPSFTYNRRKDSETGLDVHLVGADWDFQTKQDIENAKKLKSYVGIRHFYGLKLRGQRTGSRGAGQRGRSGKTVGVIRDKIVAAKQQAAAAEAGKGGSEKK